MILSLASSAAEAFPLSKEPELELTRIVTAFIEAGSYAWEEQRISVERRIRPPDPISSGQAEINGFSVFEFHRRQMVQFGRELVIEVNGTWRHIDELSDAERRMFYLAPGRRFEVLMPALPHDILAALLPAVRFVRKEDKVFVAEMDSSRLTGPALAAFSLGSGTRLRLRLETSGGALSGFTVEVLRPAIFVNGPEPGERDVVHATHEFKVSSIGATRPGVPRGARILFVNPAAR